MTKRALLKTCDVYSNRLELPDADELVLAKRSTVRLFFDLLKSRDFIF